MAVRAKAFLCGLGKSRHGTLLVRVTMPAPLFADNAMSRTNLQHLRPHSAGDRNTIAFHLQPEEPMNTPFQATSGRSLQQNMTWGSP